MLLIPVGTKWTVGERDEKEEKVNTAGSKPEGSRKGQGDAFNFPIPTSSQCKDHLTPQDKEDTRLAW